MSNILENINELIYNNQIVIKGEYRDERGGGGFSIPGNPEEAPEEDPDTKKLKSALRTVSLLLAIAVTVIGFKESKPRDQYIEQEVKNKIKEANLNELEKEELLKLLRDNDYNPYDILLVIQDKYPEEFIHFITSKDDGKFLNLRQTDIEIIAKYIDNNPRILDGLSNEQRISLLQGLNKDSILYDTISNRFNFYDEIIKTHGDDNGEVSKDTLNFIHNLSNEIPLKDELIQKAREEIVNSDNFDRELIGQYNKLFDNDINIRLQSFLDDISSFFNDNSIFQLGLYGILFSSISLITGGLIYRKQKNKIFKTCEKTASYYGMDVEMVILLSDIYYDFSVFFIKYIRNKEDFNKSLYEKFKMCRDYILSHNNRNKILSDIKSDRFFSGLNIQFLNKKRFPTVNEELHKLLIKENTKYIMFKEDIIKN